MSNAIAIVGIACRYPDAENPEQLWENVLYQRQSFRRIPSVRLRIEDYLSKNGEQKDTTYIDRAALIEGFYFDRSKFQIPIDTYRSTDHTHWLALDVASKAIDDVRFTDNKKLPKETTGVIIGNSLTGEFSRAQLMRLRWPYVRRVINSSLSNTELSDSKKKELINEIEKEYKAPFFKINEDTLAGGLSNTIAGRICNHFNFNGGGYTVDGACSSSLLAVASACSVLEKKDLDVAVVGGVDLSIDPFELVGFAHTGALAKTNMLVYDQNSNGFIPGEGCGFVVLMRYDDALAQDHRIYAVIKGWGISSDGRGGLIRPKKEGQILALKRAYQKAGFDINTVSYFEGHGTGTKIGDETELKALKSAICPSLAKSSIKDISQLVPAAIGSIKANIGHTKAAAGIAGLIKATMAVSTGIIPPTTACHSPHNEINNGESVLRVIKNAEAWPARKQRRAGVSAMGFGGINSHIVVEDNQENVPQFNSVVSSIPFSSSSQDMELFLFSGKSKQVVLDSIKNIKNFSSRLSLSDMTDLAAEMEKTIEYGKIRAAILASDPHDLVRKLGILYTWLETNIQENLHIEKSIFLSHKESNTMRKIGLLFPGQASPIYSDGGILACRCSFIKEFYSNMNLPKKINKKSTETTQQSIVTSELAGLYMLQRFGIAGEIAVGHSLGEIFALHWAEVIDEDTLQKVVRMRGKYIDQLSEPSGKMAVIYENLKNVSKLIKRNSVDIAAINSNHQTVVSGKGLDIESVIGQVKERGIRATILKIPNAFHSSLMSNVLPEFSKFLKSIQFNPPRRKIVSTITGELLNSNDDFRNLIAKQLISTVLFERALRTADTNVDLWIEVGPGNVLSSIANDIVETPIISLDVGGASLRGPLQAIAAAFVIGSQVNHHSLFEDRFTRPFNLDWQPNFLANPCETPPIDDSGSKKKESSTEASETKLNDINSDSGYLIDSVSPEKPIEVFRNIIANHLELPLEAIGDDNNLMADLHLNSITISQLVDQASRQLGISPPTAPTEFSNATIQEVSWAFDELQRLSDTAAIDENQKLPKGIDNWIRAFALDWIPTSLSVEDQSKTKGDWHVITPPKYPLAEKLKLAFSKCKIAGGVVVCLPKSPQKHTVNLLLRSARMVLNKKKANRYIVVHHGCGGSGFAKTLFLENPSIAVSVIEVPIDNQLAVQWIADEAIAANGFHEIRYDDLGQRFEPQLIHLPLDDEKSQLPIGNNDVLLVTGGGKGIAAECALALSQKTGVRLVLIGRSHPETDEELSKNLQRISDSGSQFIYLTADVVNTKDVHLAVRRAEKELGPITAVIHGAGMNVPQLITTLDEEAFQRTLAPKFLGLKNVLSAVNDNYLRVLITFSSIIGRIGLTGEADYAQANEWLTWLTEKFKDEHPDCICLALEWSIWSGVGMGQRLGRVELLERQGITPITPEAGISALYQLLGQPSRNVSVVVAGRFNTPPTIQFKQRNLPKKRFFEIPRVYYPGVELVVDNSLSLKSDPYLYDHIYQKQILFPGVMGLEAMTQVAMELLETDELPIIDDIVFSKAIVIPATGTRTIRIAGLKKESGVVEVVLRSDETSFHTNHFSARFQVNVKFRHTRPSKSNVTDYLKLNNHLKLNPNHDIYGTLLFHEGRFRRLQSYRKLSASESIAEISVRTKSKWFKDRSLNLLTFADPGVRDAAIHSIQACIPHWRLLPIGVDRITTVHHKLGNTVYAFANERYRKGQDYVFDIEIVDFNGILVEKWNGLKLRKVERLKRNSPWVIPLLGPYIVRRCQNLLTESNIKVAILNNIEDENIASSDIAIHEVAGKSARISRRPDGKPEVSNGLKVSLSNSNGFIFAVSGNTDIGCDLEAVKNRSAEGWKDLLGADRLELVHNVNQETNEEYDISATRLWTVMECLKKTGMDINAPLVFEYNQRDTCVVFRTGLATAVTFALQIETLKTPQVFSVLSTDELTCQFGQPKYYSYKHVVGFEETNVVGNVYYTNYLLWQGHCREMFLMEKAKGILDQIKEGLLLSTTNCQCEYFVELESFDKVEVRMFLDAINLNRIDLSFEYWRLNNGNSHLVARGKQQIACTLPDGNREIPDILEKALRDYKKCG